MTVDPGGIAIGDVKVNVFVRVMLRYVAVELRSVQKLPPSVVAVLTGSVKALNAELVR